MARQRLKPGEHGEIFISQHKPRQWRAKTRVRLLDGEEAQVSRVGHSAEAARLNLQAALAERFNLPTGSGDLRPDSKVGLACRQWINELRVRSAWPNAPIRPQSVDEYERLLANHLIPQLGKRRLNELTTAICQEWLDQILEKGRNGPHDLVVTAIQVRSAFGAVLDRAIVHDAIRSNPVDKTKLPRRKKPQPRALTVLEIQRLRRAVREWEASRQGRPGPRPTGHLPAAIDVMLGSGLRIGEVMALRWREVNLATDGLPTISVDATQVDIRGAGTVRQEMPKTDAGQRIIIIPPFVVAALQSIRPVSPHSESPVFPSRRFRDGSSSPTPQTPHNVRRTLRAALETAGMKGDVYPHKLRKTVATFVARERGTADAAALLGHKIHGGVTERHYVERLRVAPDVSAVLQAMIEIGEKEAVRDAEPVRSTHDSQAVRTTSATDTEGLADEGSGW